MKAKSIDVGGVDSISDFNPNLSPSHPKGLQNTKSNIMKANSKLVSQSHHGKF